MELYVTFQIFKYLHAYLYMKPSHWSGVKLHKQYWSWEKWERERKREEKGREYLTIRNIRIILYRAVDDNLESMLYFMIPFQISYINDIKLYVIV